MANSSPASQQVGRISLILGLGWGMLLLMALFFVQRDALRYFDYSAEAYRHHWALRVWLIPHILGAGSALLLAPLQFWPALRARRPAVHRWTGRIYAVGCLVASATALRLALGSRCELCIPPLAILSCLWFGFTLIAFYAAIRRAIDIHRQFMIRSYVLMNAFVIIRLTDYVQLPLAVQDENAVRSVFEWVCWVVPLLVTEAWLNWGPAIRRGLGQRGTRKPVATHTG